MTAKSSHRVYPDGSDIRLSGRDESKRFYFKTPTNGRMSVPGMNVEQARQLAADEFRGFGPEDFEHLENPEDYDPEPYPDPVDSGRDVTENDLWLLRHAMLLQGRVGRKLSNRRNPTERMIQAVVDEWDDPAAVPLADVEALQQADGIGPHAASRIVGAAVANRLIERPERGEL